jgi:hypothetical protein
MTFIDNIKPLKISAAGDQRERFFKKMTFSTDSLALTKIFNRQAHCLSMGFVIGW